MKRMVFRSFLTCLAALALTLTARADVTWDYSVTFGGGATQSTVSSGGSTVTLNGDSRANNVGSTTITLANLMASSSTPSSSLDTFSSAPWSLTLNITDKGTTTTTQSLTFTGTFNGTMNSTSSVFLPGSNTPSGSQTTTFSSDGNSYQVMLTSFTPPSFSAPYGGIGALVTVTPGNLGGGNGAGFAPEPSSLVLCGLGGLGCLAAWRKRRQMKLA